LTHYKHHDILVCRKSESLPINLFRRILMAKSRDTRKDAKKKPVKSKREKKRAKEEKKKKK